MIIGAGCCSFSSSKPCHYLRYCERTRKKSKEWRILKEAYSGNALAQPKRDVKYGSGSVSIGLK